MFCSKNVGCLSGVACYVLWSFGLTVFHSEFILNCLPRWKKEQRVWMCLEHIKFQKACLPAQCFQCYRMICIIAHIHDNSSGSILEFLKSLRLCFTEHIPYFTAVIEVWADNSIINGKKCLPINKIL